jgi:hypothetical protein
VIYINTPKEGPRKTRAFFCFFTFTALKAPASVTRKSVLISNNSSTLADNADDAVGLMLGLENVRSLGKLALGKNYDITDTHIEDAVHFVAVDLALILDELEDRRNFPG